MENDMEFMLFFCQNWESQRLFSLEEQINHKVIFIALIYLWIGLHEGDLAYGFTQLCKESIWCVPTLCDFAWFAAKKSECSISIKQNLVLFSRSYHSYLLKTCIGEQQIWIHYNVQPGYIQMCECLIPLFPVPRRVCRLCDKIVVRNMMSNCSNELLLLFLCRPFLIIKWNPDNKCFYFLLSPFPDKLYRAGTSRWWSTYNTGKPCLTSLPYRKKED